MVAIYLYLYECVVVAMKRDLAHMIKNFHPSSHLQLKCSRIKNSGQQYYLVRKKEVIEDISASYNLKSCALCPFSLPRSKWDSAQQNHPLIRHGLFCELQIKELLQCISNGLYASLSGLSLEWTHR